MYSGAHVRSHNKCSTRTRREPEVRTEGSAMRIPRRPVPLVACARREVSWSLISRAKSFLEHHCHSGGPCSWQQKAKTGLVEVAWLRSRFVWMASPDKAAVSLVGQAPTLDARRIEERPWCGATWSVVT